MAPEGEKKKKLAQGDLGAKEKAAPVLDQVRQILSKTDASEKSEPQVGRKLRAFKKGGGRTPMPPETKKLLDELMRAPFEPFSQPDALQIIRKLQLADPETSADIDLSLIHI